MEATVKQKLRALTKLQAIDSELDEIKKMRGELPDEIRDIEDELIGFDARLNKEQTEIKEKGQEIEDNKRKAKEAEKLIAKYEEQQMQVRNNREYDAIAKEIEYQKLEIEHAEKKNKQGYEKIKALEEGNQQTQTLKDEKQTILKNKQGELDSNIKDSSVREEELLEKREIASQKVEERLANAYKKIRLGARNGLAVVSVSKDACGGCFNIVPPQRQADIREQKKILLCEYCGRILADVQKEEKKPKKISKRKAAKKTAKKPKATSAKAASAKAATKTSPKTASAKATSAKATSTKTSPKATSAKATSTKTSPKATSAKATSTKTSPKATSAKATSTKTSPKATSAKATSTKTSPKATSAKATSAKKTSAKAKPQAGA